MAAGKGGVRTPLSVIIAEISRAGVTSNAGLYTFIPFGAACAPRNVVTSSACLSSMGMSSPVLIEKSNVETGAAI